MSRDESKTVSVQIELVPEKEEALCTHRQGSWVRTIRAWKHGKSERKQTKHKHENTSTSSLTCVDYCLRLLLCY